MPFSRSIEVELINILIVQPKVPLSPRNLPWRLSGIMDHGWVSPDWLDEDNPLYYRDHNNNSFKICFHFMKVVRFR